MRRRNQVNRNSIRNNRGNGTSRKEPQGRYCKKAQELKANQQTKREMKKMFLKNQTELNMKNLLDGHNNGLEII